MGIAATVVGVGIIAIGLREWPCALPVRTTGAAGSAGSSMRMPQITSWRPAADGGDALPGT
ncbi:hypothetical protein CEY15_14530 [Dietzia natronolimnaea]|uniref:Uncharacterized protein n=1 Tax=Dietzia natronolimnaea TaxID=161920 RepID=A0A2A2WM91_9ACTN|nr:hypothetical protein CEY15_14530 [Dietzia natronolimnaea]